MLDVRFEKIYMLVCFSVAVRFCPVVVAVVIVVAVVVVVGGGGVVVNVIGVVSCY